MKKVAVIMSVYRSDSLEFLKDAVNSIIAQTYNEVSFFIYRDGVVPPEVDEYLKFIELTYKNIILIVSESNSGLAYALNMLIDHIILDGSFSYIARMDSDDISRTERINKQVDFFECNSRVDVCGTSCREFGASFALEAKHLPESHEELLDFSITHCPFIHPSVMFSVDVFSSGIRYPTDTSLTEDMALWFVLLNKGVRFSNLNEVLIDYRLNENTIERRSGWDKAWSEFRIRYTNMLSLNKVSFRNIMLVSARLVFHLLPNSVMKLAYRKAR
ncbi:MAG TPA: glycosyl transferase [Colwellia sp.]|nr:glycosyl transferase [Colwellia sp.]|tara:strand:+ start:9753 stop:10571 length:819 start_codon:yes stop_codon:yes gene_type:complete